MHPGALAEGPQARHWHQRTEHLVQAEGRAATCEAAQLSMLSRWTSSEPGPNKDDAKGKAESTLEGLGAQDPGAVGATEG